MVMPKKNEQWKVYIDHTDLNKACTKDSLSLSQPTRRCDRWSSVIEFFRRLFGVQLDQNRPEGSRENIIHYRQRNILLQCDVVHLKNIKATY